MLAAYQREILDPGSKQHGTSIVKLEPEIVAVFPDAASVNKALRYLIQDSKENSEEFFPIQQPKTK